MKKISVIIPVYNIEKYIRKCLESVINQTYKNLEIIVVNDGTKDNSMEIVREYLEDNRIIVINKENGGLSSARNKGLEIATGDYISFVDSDDYLEKDLYSKLIEKVEDEDIIVFDSRYIDTKTQKILQETKNVNIDSEKIKVLKNEKNNGLEYYFDLSVVVWDKIYKRDFLKKYNLKFVEGIIYEDIPWSYEVYLLAKKVKYLNMIGYNYQVNRENSIMHCSQNNKIKDKSNYSYSEIINYLGEIIKRRKLNIEEILLLKISIETIRIKKDNKVEFLELEEVIKDYFNDENISMDNKKIMSKYLKNLFRDKRARVFNIKLLSIYLWKNIILDFLTFNIIIENKIRFIN